MAAFSNDGDRSVFVSNLSSRVTEEIIFELFLQAGPVESCKVKERPRSRPMAHIVYKHGVSQAYAFEVFKGTTLFGHELEMSASDTGDVSALRGHNMFPLNGGMDYIDRPERRHHRYEAYERPGRREDRYGRRNDNHGRDHHHHDRDQDRRGYDRPRHEQHYRRDDRRRR